MNKVWSAIAASCLVLAACSAGEPVAPVPKKADTSEVEALAPEPLASDAEITAAETAPVLRIASVISSTLLPGSPPIIMAAERFLSVERCLAASASMAP